MKKNSILKYIFNRIFFLLFKNNLNELMLQPISPKKFSDNSSTFSYVMGTEKVKI